MPTNENERKQEPRSRGEELLARANEQAKAAEEAFRKRVEASREKAMEEIREAESKKNQDHKRETEAETAAEAPDIDYSLQELKEDYDGYERCKYETEELFDLVYVDGRYCKNRTEALLSLMHNSLAMIVRELHYKNTHPDKDTE